MNTSKKYQLNFDDVKKILIGLGIAVGGAVLTYLEVELVNVDFGSWTPVVVAINSIIVNTGRKFLMNYSQ